MRDPAKTARKLLGGLFTLVIAPVVGQWFITLAESFGLYGDKLRAVQEALTSFFNWIGLNTVIAAAAFLLGAIGGARLNARLSKTQDTAAAHQASEQRSIQTVGFLAVELAARIKRKVVEYERIPGHDLEQIRAETYAFMVELRNHGFETDEIINHIQRDARALVFSRDFLTRLGPLLRDGHVEQAHVVARDILPTLSSALNGPALMQARSSRYGR